MRECGNALKIALMCECVNALVGIHETSPWGDGNLADGVFIKIFFQFQK